DDVDPPVHDGDPVAHDRVRATLSINAGNVEHVLQDHFHGEKQQEATGDECHDAIAVEGGAVFGVALGGGEFCIGHVYSPPASAAASSRESSRTIRHHTARAKPPKMN